jgi:hypothetical protein
MITSGQRLEIELSKTKIFLLLMASLGFVALGLWFVINPKLWSNSPLIPLVGYCAIVFFGVCAFFLAAKLRDNKPGLIIDDHGLIDNSSGLPGGEIPWSDITNITVIEINRQKLIMLEVRNPEQYIARQTSGFKRKLMEINFKMYGTPLSISANSLKISFDELWAILSSRLNDN